MLENLFFFRYDPEHGRFTDPPSEYTTTVNRTENYKYCESCVRKAAKEQVITKRVTTETGGASWKKS